MKTILAEKDAVGLESHLNSVQMKVAVSITLSSRLFGAFKKVIELKCVSELIRKSNAPGH